MALGSNGQPSKSQRLVSYRDVIWARKMPSVTSVYDIPWVEPGQTAPGHLGGDGMWWVAGLVWVPGVSTNTAVHLQGKSCALKRRSHQRIWPRHKRAQFGPVL